MFSKWSSGQLEVGQLHLAGFSLQGQSRCGMVPKTSEGGWVRGRLGLFQAVESESSSLHQVMSQEQCPEATEQGTWSMSSFPLNASQGLSF